MTTDIAAVSPADLFLEAEALHRRTRRQRAAVGTKTAKSWARCPDGHPKYLAGRCGLEAGE